MRDYSKYIGIFSDLATETIGDMMKEELKDFLASEENRRIIEDYLYLTNKLNEIDYRLNPKYTLSVVNRKDVNKGYILAKVKWPFLFKGRIKSPPYISVHIGSLKRYPKGVNDPELLSIVDKKIKDYINEVAPLELKNANGDNFIMK